MLCREDIYRFFLSQYLTGQAVDFHDPLDYVTPEFNADGNFLICRKYFERITTDAEFAA